MSEEVRRGRLGSAIPALTGWGAATGRTSGKHSSEIMPLIDDWLSNASSALKIDDPKPEGKERRKW